MREHAIRRESQEPLRKAGYGGVMDSDIQTGPAVARDREGTIEGQPLKYSAFLKYI